MTNRKAITKEWLQTLGFTNVTEDGEIFFKDKECVERVVTCKHKHSEDKQYPVIVVYDKELYEANKETSKRSQHVLLVSRIVFAWFNDICPSEYDVDHIDNNPFNNSISNLQLLTRKENLNRHLARNQYTYHISDEDLKKFREECVNYKYEIERCRFYIGETKEAIRILSNEISLLKELSKVVSNYNIYKEVINDKKVKLEELKDTLKRDRANWHYWCTAYNEFKKRETPYNKRKHIK